MTPMGHFYRCSAFAEFWLSCNRRPGAGWAGGPNAVCPLQRQPCWFGLHDVTVGNNSVPCTSGTPNCALDSESDYFESGYNGSLATIWPPAWGAWTQHN